jgi:hypothetical protein
MGSEPERLDRYLLGTLGEDEQTAIESQLFADDQWLDRLELAEDELIEAYVRHHLSSAERARFEHHFLRSPRRRQLTEIAALMWRMWGAAVGEQPAPQPRTWFTSRFEIPFSRATVPAVAGLMVAVLLAGTAWLTVTLDRERTRAASRNKTAAEQIAARQNEIDRLTRELRNDQTQDQPAAVPAGVVPDPNSLFAVALTPGVVRGREPRPLALPNGAVAVRLTLQTDTAPPPGQQVVVLRFDTGSEVWHTQWTRSRDAASSGAEVIVPVAVLRPGRYILEWSAMEESGRSRPIEDYQLSIASHR